MRPIDHVGCADHHETTRAALLRRQAAARLPLPNALLDEGAGSFLAQGRSRREFLAGGIGAVLAVSAVSRLDPFRLVEQAAAADQPNAPIVVMLYMDGGNDGLNTLLPLQGPDRAIYEQSRPRIAIAPDQALSLGGTSDIGWHPAAAGLKTLYDAGKLGVLPATDYPNPDQSHFHSRFFWRTAQFNDNVQTGWLGRYLDVAGVRDNPLQGVAVDWSADELLQSTAAPTCAVSSPAGFDFWTQGVWGSGQERMLGAWRDMGRAARRPALQRAAEVTRESYAVRQALRPLASQDPKTLPAPPVAYPKSGTGDALANLARMLGAGLGIRVATVTADGAYDTHHDQPNTQTKNLQDIGDALVAWQADLAARGLEDRVLTVVWSEFGRRVHDNDSSGTDHGAGGLMFLVGSRVRSGIYADRFDTVWGLAGGLDDGNVRVGIDFRDVYAGILQQHLGVEAARVIPGYAGAPVQVLR